jgi:hypothetical protein
MLVGRQGRSASPGLTGGIQTVVLADASAMYNRYIIALVTLLGAYIAFRVYVEWATFNHPVTAEARVLNATGKTVFVRVPNPVYEDRVAIGSAVFKDSGFWPNHVVYSGNRTYAFGPFGQVFVLVAAGIDAEAVASRSHWKGEPRDYRYPETPSKGDGASQVVSPNQPRNE